MAKNESIIKLKGNIGGLSFYDADGKNFVRMANGVDKDRIMKDPAFKRTRENMREFGGSAKVGKAFRMCFAEVTKSMGEKYLSARITALMRKINSMGAGARGERAFELSNFSDIIQGFEFNRQDPFGSKFFAPYDPISFNADRDVVTWNIPVFNTDSYITAPEGSTHFKLILAAGILSNYAYNSGSEEYEPTEAALNSVKGLAESGEIPLGGMTAAAINLVVDLGIGAALAPDVIVPTATGIVFYQEINSQFYTLASDNAMRIDAVG